MTVFHQPRLDALVAANAEFTATCAHILEALAEWQQVIPGHQPTAAAEVLSLLEWLQALQHQALLGRLCALAQEVLATKTIGDSSLWTW